MAFLFDELSRARQNQSQSYNKLWGIFETYFVT